MEATITYKEIEIPIGNIHLKGNLRLSEKSKGIILFSHGSGSSRLSSRNNHVADFLFTQGFSSLLFDLLTPQEDTIYENRFDIELLSKRLLQATLWIGKNKSTKHLPIGYFGASTGAASALTAAATLGTKIKAIVSRGGRPDLAIPVLNKIQIPTLLIVGGNDDVVIELNKKAKNKIKGICEIKIVEGASHLFEEYGALDKVALYSANWFNSYLN
ncbi:alpha/beta hydrolase [Flaviramulus sp. BrNp1-15]|uniref:dienelactone hydrolase family protein n=1 Tax=Flaviramulus sp. BrNp1-15 TaxID=2916754 RepID=UPI001EE842ED|nr:alpha/beta hydrolase [Flaviramulus sp. BrNp1-15]ULC57899.1 alpha/beta hydrolase [Flaviramulus sp. BrNp1-15]